MGRVVIPGFRKIETSGGGEGGTTNYNDLTNKPSINNVPLVGNLKTVDLKLTDATLTEEGVPAEAKTVGQKLEEQSTSLTALSNQLGNHTVKSDVPENAVFTDTVYDDTEVKEEIASINSNLTSEISRAKETEEVLKSRIDTITSLPEGSTTGDAELQDIRVKADGTTATTAGNAVREQFNELKEDLSEHEDMICMVEHNNLIDLSYTNIYGCVFSSPTYVNKFKCIFTDDSYGSVTYVLAKTNDNEKIKDGSVLSGIESKRFTVDINEFINIDMLLDESYAILVATNENAHIKIVNSTKSTYGAYLCQMNKTNNTIENYDIHKNNYRFAMSFSGKIIGNKVNVRQDGTGDFESITEALSHFFYGDNVTIMLGKGKYNESINVGNKYDLSIIGECVDHCVVFNTSGMYKNAPFTISGNVFMENIQLSMYADDSFVPDISSQDTFAGYALHIDGVSRDPNSFNYATFINCKFYSTAFPAVGLGTQQRQSIKFDNCEFIRNCTNENYKFDNWKGAFIGHPDNGSEQNLTFMNCYFESNYGKSGNLRTDVGEPYSLTLKAINNTFYSKEEGLNSFEYIQGQTYLHGSSHGNTSTNLNVG